MSAIPVRILSYIANFRKIIISCPLCHEHDSLILPEDFGREHSHKCTNCRKDYTMDLAALEYLKLK